MSIDMKDVLTGEMILRERMQEFERAQAISRHILNKAYERPWEQRTCLSCGSATQPCCGH